MDQFLLESRDRKRIHKVADQHLIEIIRNSPKKEQSRYQEKREKSARRKKYSASHGRHLPLSRAGHAATIEG
jgi:hypothetical protein